jgi:hypothetical protein
VAAGFGGVCWLCDVEENELMQGSVCLCLKNI